MTITDLTFLIASKVSKVHPYWIQGNTSMIKNLDLGNVANQLQEDDSFCLTMENTANKSNPILIKSRNCTQKTHVICKLEVPKAIETPLPPKFPCISDNKAATRKNKREVESMIKHRQNELMDARGKD